MPRPKNLQPVYKLHKPTNTARCWVGGKWVSRGRYGSPESRVEHARILSTIAASAAESNANKPQPTPVTSADDPTIAEVLAAFMQYARGKYRHADGKPKSELYDYKLSARPLLEELAHTPAKDFGPKALKMVRGKMLAAGWCRKPTNARIDRIKRVFKWAASEELVPAAVFHALKTVDGLRAGEWGAKDRAPVQPVADAVVDATLPFLNRYLRGLVTFQRLNGCRPSEACALRRCDIDTSGAVWLFRPVHHKNAWRGKPRVIPIGPKAQTLIEGFFTDDPAAYLFSPRLAVAEFHAGRAANRKTPKYGNAKRTATPKRTPAEKYTANSYGHAIANAAKRTNVANWSPNQLRHGYATAVRRDHGLEAAQVLLGHSNAKTTEIYGERNEALAVKIAAQIG